MWNLKSQNTAIVKVTMITSTIGPFAIDSASGRVTLLANVTFSPRGRAAEIANDIRVKYSRSMDAEAKLSREPGSYQLKNPIFVPFRC